MGRWLLPNIKHREKGEETGDAEEEDGERVLGANEAAAAGGLTPNQVEYWEQLLTGGGQAHLSKFTSGMRGDAGVELDGLATAEAAAAVGGGVTGGLQRHLHSVIGPDERTPCSMQTYPNNVLGQIMARSVDGKYLCSGALVGADRVLTAAHCVWDDRAANAPFLDLSFAPNQTKTGVRVNTPHGKIGWDYITLFKAYIDYPDTTGLAYDVAIITLKKDVGNKLGWLGLKAEMPPCGPMPTSLTLAGYPGDDPATPKDDHFLGSCYQDQCVVSLSCGAQVTNHTCDSYVGQSGAPMFDEDRYIRLVHTLGVLAGFSDENGGITMTKFIVDNVMGYWKHDPMADAKYTERPSGW
jgi:V8-like Glu-specific endopeptidase